MTGGDDHLAAQLIIALSPSLNAALGGTNGTSGTTSNLATSTTDPSLTTENPATATGGPGSVTSAGTASIESPSAVGASTNVPLPTINLSSQLLTTAGPVAVPTGQVGGILPQNIPEPPVLSSLVVLAVLLAVRYRRRDRLTGMR